MHSSLSERGGILRCLLTSGTFLHFNPPPKIDHHVDGCGATDAGGDGGDGGCSQWFMYRAT